MVISLGVLPHADGSAAIRQGNTWVLASVSGPHDERGGGGGGGAGGSGGGTTTTATGVPQGAHTEDAGLVRCTVTTARFSTPAGRKPSVRSGGDIADAVASTFTAVALTGLFGRSIVDVHVQVLVDDGCVRSAAINATAAALADAGVAMTDLVAGCGVAFVGGVALVDPTSYRGFIHRPRTGQANDTSSGVHRDSWSPPTAAGQQSPTTTANLTRTSPRQSPRQSKI